MPSEDTLNRTDSAVSRFRFAMRVLLVMNITLLGCIAITILLSR